MAAASFPTADTTGVPPNLVLKKSGGVDARTAGQVIQNLDITGYVEISAANVTLKNCKIRATSWAAVIVKGANATIDHCEVLSQYATGGSKGVQFDGGSSGVVRFCNIWNCEDGVYIGTKNVTVEDNYIHDAKSGGADPHYDGIQLHGGVSSDITIRRNNVLMKDVENSAITMGVVQRVTVEGNHLDGGGYTVYVDARFGEGTTADVNVVNNVFGSHNFGFMAIENCNPFVAGNVDEAGKPLPNQDTETPIPPPTGGDGGGGETPPGPEPAPAQMTGEMTVGGVVYSVLLTLTPK